MDNESSKLAEISAADIERLIRILLASADKDGIVTIEGRQTFKVLIREVQ